MSEVKKVLHLEYSSSSSKLLLKEYELEERRAIEVEKVAKEKKAAAEATIVIEKAGKTLEEAIKESEAAKKKEIEEAKANLETPEQKIILEKLIKINPFFKSTQTQEDLKKYISNSENIHTKFESLVEIQREINTKKSNPRGKIGSNEQYEALKEIGKRNKELNTECQKLSLGFTSEFNASEKKAKQAAEAAELAGITLIQLIFRKNKV